MGIVVPSSTFLSLDPLFVLICGPILLFLSAKYLESRKTLDGLVKIGLGFLCVSASFGILALSACQDGDHLVSPLWVIIAMFIQTLGELWIAPVSFSKISQHAPPQFKSILMSFWSMAISYGHYFAAFVANFSLDNASSVCGINSFERYGKFFTYLALPPLCVGLSLLLYLWIKSYIIAKGCKQIKKEI